jgi:hypothetical protein
MAACVAKERESAPVAVAALRGEVSQSAVAMEREPDPVKGARADRHTFSDALKSNGSLRDIWPANRQA